MLHYGQYTLQITEFIIIVTPFWNVNLYSFQTLSVAMFSTETRSFVWFFFHLRKTLFRIVKMLRLVCVLYLKKNARRVPDSIFYRPFFSISDRYDDKRNFFFFVGFSASRTNKIKKKRDLYHDRTSLPFSEHNRFSTATIYCRFRGTD